VEGSAQAMPGERSSAVRLEVVSSLSAFAALDGWDALVEAMPRPSPFLLQGWLAAWVSHYGAGAELAVHVARRGGRIVAALPVVRQRRRGILVSKFPGGKQSNFADLMLAPGEPAATGAALVEEMRAHHDLAQLHGLPAESRLVECAPAGSMALFRRIEAPVLELSQGWEAIRAERLTAKRRRSLRTRRRQLEDRGQVTFEVARSPDDVDDALAEVFRLHRLRWQGPSDGSGFATPTGMAFHRAALGALAARKVVRLVTMRSGGRAIAFALGFTVAGRYYGYRTAFDPAFARYGPGLMVVHEANAGVADEGVTRIEMLGGADAYKLEVADRVEPLHLGLGLAGTPRGRAVVVARVGALRVRERLRASPTAQRAYGPIRPLLGRLRARGGVLKT
jgi:CelD/BcsL family acetyltransferase involved in cellulose biosynthesis